MTFSLTKKALMVLTGAALSANSFALFWDHDAHEHGHAELNVVLEKNELQLLFTSPAMDIVGFEHAPSSKDDFKAVEQAKALFENAKNLFELPAAAQCELEHVKIESALLEDEHKEEKHDHDHHDHDDHDEEHSEFAIEYHFECNQPNELTQIKTTLLEKFKSLEEVEAKIVSPKGQKLVELEDKVETIEL